MISIILRNIDRENMAFWNVHAYIISRDRSYQSSHWVQHRVRLSRDRAPHWHDMWKFNSIRYVKLLTATCCLWLNNPFYIFHILPSCRSYAENLQCDVLYTRNGLFWRPSRQEACVRRQGSNGSTHPASSLFVKSRWMALSTAIVNGLSIGKPGALPFSTTWSEECSSIFIVIRIRFPALPVACEVWWLKREE